MSTALPLMIATGSFGEQSCGDIKYLIKLSATLRISSFTKYLSFKRMFGISFDNHLCLLYIKCSHIVRYDVVSTPRQDRSDRRILYVAPLLMALILASLASGLPVPSMMLITCLFSCNPISSNLSKTFQSSAVRR